MQRVAVGLRKEISGKVKQRVRDLREYLLIFCEEGIVGNVILWRIWGAGGPLTFPLDPRARAGQKFEILARKPRPQPDKNEGLEPGYLGQVSGQNRQHRSLLMSIHGFPGAVGLPWLSHW
jgi:hypothetical protein